MTDAAPNPETTTTRRDRTAAFPRILAIADLHAPTVVGTRSDDLIAFYGELIGLRYLGHGQRDSELIFKGHPEISPHLILDLELRPPPKWLRRVALIEVPALPLLIEQLEELRRPYELLRGWSPYDRRVLLTDPGENLIELVACHGL